MNPRRHAVRQPNTRLRLFAKPPRIQNNQIGRLIRHIHHQSHHPTIILRRLRVARNEHEFAWIPARPKIVPLAPTLNDIMFENRRAPQQPRLDPAAIRQAKRIRVPVRLSRQPLIDPQKFLPRIVQHRACHALRRRIDRPALEPHLLAIRPPKIAVTVAIMRADIHHHPPIIQIV